MVSLKYLMNILLVLAFVSKEVSDISSLFPLPPFHLVLFLLFPLSQPQSYFVIALPFGKVEPFEVTSPLSARRDRVVVPVEV